MIDPQGPVDGVARVLRGGTYRSDSFSNRVSYRYSGFPDQFVDQLGFRAARAP